MSDRILSKMDKRRGIAKKSSMAALDNIIIEVTKQKPSKAGAKSDAQIGASPTTGKRKAGSPGTSTETKRSRRASRQSTTDESNIDKVTTVVPEPITNTPSSRRGRSRKTAETEGFKIDMQSTPKRVGKTSDIKSVSSDSKGSADKRRQSRNSKITTAAASAVNVGEDKHSSIDSSQSPPTKAVRRSTPRGRGRPSRTSTPKEQVDDTDKCKSADSVQTLSPNTADTPRRRKGNPVKAPSSKAEESEVASEKCSQVSVPDGNKDSVGSSVITAKESVKKVRKRKKLEEKTVTEEACLGDKELPRADVSVENEKNNTPGSGKGRPRKGKSVHKYVSPVGNSEGARKHEPLVTNDSVTADTSFRSHSECVSAETGSESIASDSAISDAKDLSQSESASADTSLEPGAALEAGLKTRTDAYVEPAGESSETREFTVNSTGAGDASHSLQNKAVADVPSEVILSPGNYHVAGFAPAESPKNIDYRKTVAQRRHTFVTPYGRPRKDVNKRTASPTGSPNQNPVQKGALGQQELPGIISSQSQMSKPTSPVKIFMVPPGQNLLSSTAPMSLVTQKSPITGKQETITIQKIGSTQRRLGTASGSSSTPQLEGQKLVAASSVGGTSTEDTMVVPEMTTTCQKSTLQAKVDDDVQPSTVIVVQPGGATIEQIKENKGKKGGKVENVKKSKEAKLPNKKTKRTKKIDDGATENPETKAVLEKVPSTNTDTDVAIDNMVAKLKESMKQNPNLGAEVMSKLEGVLHLTTDKGKGLKGDSSVDNSAVHLEESEPVTASVKKRGRPSKKSVSAKKSSDPKSSAKKSKKKVKDEAARSPTPPRELPEPQPEFTPSGRLRRGAAKKAIQFLRDSRVLSEGQTGDEEGNIPPDDPDGDASDIDPDVTLSSDADADVTSDDDVDAEIEEEPEAEELTELKKISSKKKGGKKRKKAVITGPKSKGGMTLTDPGNMYRTAQKSLSWIQSLGPGDPVFCQWNTTKEQWKRLTANSPVLPSSTHNVKFEVNVGKVRQQSATLERFSAMSKNGKTFVNAGGPVKSMAWCPMPLSSHGDQYAAIYAHKSPDITHALNGVHKYDSAIQIWNFGSLKNQCDDAPHLALLVQNPFGAVWDMTWCPLNAWSAEEGSEKHLPRLGLLALACSDGKVYIVSVPKPEGLHSAADKDLPLYSVPEKAVVTLNPYFSEDESEFSQCFCVDWQVADNCGRLMAGFANGVVHIWDLTTTSSLLRITTSAGGTVLHPIASYHMHLSAVTGVRFCQRCPRFIVTCSRDRYCKVWDLTMPESPLHSHQKSENTAVEVPLHCPVFVVGNDCTYATDNKNCSFLVEVGYFGASNRPTLPHKASNTAISYNQWTNTLLGVDSGGEALIHLLPAAVGSRQNDKKYTAQRRKLFSTSVIHDVKMDISNQYRNIEETEGPDSDATIDISASTLVFHDYKVPTTSCSSDITLTQAHLADEDFSPYPFTMQTVACWNPNFGSHRWLAVGGESGVVRVLYLSALDNTETDELLKTVVG